MPQAQLGPRRPRARGDPRAHVRQDRYERTKIAIGADKHTHAVSSLEGRLRGVQRRQEGLIQRREEGEVIPIRLYNEKMAELVGEEERVETELLEARQRLDARSGPWNRLVDRVGKSKQPPVTLWDEMPSAGKQEFLRLAFPCGIHVLARRGRPAETDVAYRLVERTQEQFEDVLERRERWKSEHTADRTPPRRLQDPGRMAA